MRLSKKLILPQRGPGDVHVGHGKKPDIERLSAVPTGYPVNHEKYMQLAIQEARKARRQDEVPVGAVLVAADGAVLAAAHNQPISLSDPTAHAETLVLRRAAARLGNYRLLSTRLYVTVEPCAMCMGALIHARVPLLIYGTEDPKWGAAGSVYDFFQNRYCNHKIEVVGGICRDTCRKLMQDFFQEKRRN